MANKIRPSGPFKKIAAPAAPAPGQEALARPRSILQMASANVANPFIRAIMFQMDGCGGTNKSQFAFGILALLCLCGVLDAITIIMMVVGHTKFEPDKLAQPIANNQYGQYLITGAIERN